MCKFFAFIILFCLLSSFNIAQQNTGKISSQIMAVIDTIKITAEEFKKSYEFGPAFVKREKNSKLKYLNYMINEKLLALDGYSRNIDRSDRAASMLKEFQADIACEELFKKDILENIQINDSEIDTVVNKKQLEIELKWLFSNSKKEIFDFKKKINSGTSFDSLFNLQINDSIFVNDRSLKTNFYQLEKKNPQLAGIIDSLKAGEISPPIHVNDGWYIIKLENIRRNLITTESELENLRSESITALKKNKMDSLSEVYVNKIMETNAPVIAKNTFEILRSYLGEYFLQKEKYETWNLPEKLKSALEKAEKKNYNNLRLVELKEGSSFSLKDFLVWFWNRSEYIKFDESNLTEFSFSLKQLIWRMVRDKLLTDIAYKRGFNKTEEFKKQTNWWRDKIVYSMVKNEIKNSILLDNKEIKIDSSNAEKINEKLSDEFSKKMLHKILQLKQKYSVKIYKDTLEQIAVSDENDPHAIEIYYAKSGGLIPRTPYPIIDHDWINWE